jgi:hypothetical protein
VRICTAALFRIAARLRDSLRAKGADQGDAAAGTVRESIGKPRGILRESACGLAFVRARHMLSCRCEESGVADRKKMVRSLCAAALPMPRLLGSG